MNTHRSPPPMLQVDRPGAACSAAPTFSRETLIAIFTSRGKSFVLRKCVPGLRLLTQREAFALSSPTGMPIPGFAGRSRTGAHDCTLRGLAMVCRLYWDLQIRMPKRPSPGRKFFPLGPRNDGVKSSIDIYEESLGRSNSPCADPMLVLIYAAVDSIVVRTDSISASVDSISVTFFTADSILPCFKYILLI